MKLQYIAVLLTIGVAAVVPLLFLTISGLFAPRRPNAIKDEAFECGNPSTGSARGRFDVKFYLPAILFIVFDVEVVFMYPWAVKFRELGWFGLMEMSLFMVVLGLGLVYVWRKGALEWD